MFHSTWYRIVATAAAVLVTMGLCRLGFSAWMPVLVHDHWATTHSAGYIGTAISVGAFIGLLLAHPLALHLGRERLLRLALIGSIVVLALEIWLPGHDPSSTTPPTLGSFSFWWLVVLRICCGITAALGFTVGPAHIGMLVKPEFRTAAIGIVLAGAGVGAVVVSFLMPLAINIPSLGEAQGGMLMTTIVAVVFTIIAWPGLSRTKAEIAAATAPAPEPTIGRIFHLPFILMAIGLICLLIGMMPVILFSSTFLHVVKKMPVASSAMTVAAIGVGAAVGSPLMNVLIARLIGMRVTSIISASLGILACLAFIIPDMPVLLLIIAAGVAGGVTFGHAAVSSARMLQLMGPEGHLKAWSYCGIGMGVGSVTGTFVGSAMLQAGLEFRYIFIMCALAMVVMLITHALANTANTVAQTAAPES